MNQKLNSHRLAIGGAHHLHEAGHITADQRDQYQAGSRKVLAQAKKPAPMQKRGVAKPAPFGALSQSSHYMTTVNPQAAQDGDY